MGVGDSRAGEGDADMARDPHDTGGGRRSLRRGRTGPEGPRRRPEFPGLHPHRIPCRPPPPRATYAPPPLLPVNRSPEWPGRALSRGGGE
ncbi:integrase-type DNA-binding superfamily protein [Actinidia rufa]|uniref:Integrase-type DNA-binding superfamily protein n=1 Tax=Actinidia rufa TaxID=165716 RepID=A0A7J0E7L6_9ERIC|nr:integrase-type DNA-binding superfamily protein [Actinidia rufa]